MKPGLHSSCRLTCFPARLHLPLTLSTLAVTSHLPPGQPCEELVTPAVAARPLLQPESPQSSHLPNPPGSTRPKQPCKLSAVKQCPVSKARTGQARARAPVMAPTASKQKKSKDKTPTAITVYRAAFLQPTGAPIPQELVMQN